MDWLATPKQKQFIEAQEDEVLYGGAAGGGKSDALLIFSILRRAAIPGSRGLILRRTYAELERSLILRSLELLSGRATYNAGNHRWKFPNGSMIEFGYCERDEDVYHYQSAEYEDICFDELTQFGEFQYTYLLSRLRTTKSGVRCLVRAATNPGGVGHGWVKQRFIDVATPGEVYTDVATGRTRRFIPAKLADNPHIDADYGRRLDELPEAQRRALKDGDWDVFAGQVFREFRRDVHAIDPFAIPDGWLKYRAMDWGHRRPFSVGWYAVDYDGRLYRYREWYGWNGKANDGCQMDAAEVAARVKEIERGERVSFGVLDPACWAKTGHTGPSIAETFQRAGVLFHPADNDRMQGKMQVHARLKVVGGKSMLYVFSTCEHFLRTIPALTYDRNKVEDVDSDCEDHIYDELRYACMARPMTPKQPKPQAHKLPWALQTEDSRKSGYLEW